MGSGVCLHFVGIILSTSVQYIYMRPDNNKKDEEKKQNKAKQLDLKMR